MSVRCKNLTSLDKDKPTNTTEDKDTPTTITGDQAMPANRTKDDTPNNLLEQIGSICSPHLVIILGK